MGKFEHGLGTQLGAVLLWRRVPSGSLMLAVWSHQTTAAGDRKSTQLGAVLLWRRVPSGSLMLAVWSHQTTAAGDNKREIFF